MSAPNRLTTSTSLLVINLTLAACVATATPAPTPAPTATIIPTATSLPIPEPTLQPTLGAGFRFSTYGPPSDPGPEYWDSVGQQMAEKFPDATPQAIWIVSNFGIRGTIFTFPGTHDDFNIHFSSQDKNEAALTLFDQTGLKVWLQVEPGQVDVNELFRIMYAQYGHHPCVIGFGIDVEWYQSDGTPEGKPVTDEVAAEWVTTARSLNPAYRVFLKHWEQTMLPPTYRDGLLFVDDSQQLDSFDAIIDEFAAWGRSFAPAPVGFQYGYTSDQKWWGDLADPPGDIGRRILETTPNTESLFWVDFTVLQLFPPQP